MLDRPVTMHGRASVREQQVSDSLIQEVDCLRQERWQLLIDSGSQVQLPGAFAENDNFHAFPPLPAIDFKGLPEVEDVDMLDVFAGPSTNHVTVSPQEDTGLDEAEIEEWVYSVIQDTRHCY